MRESSSLPDSKSGSAAAFCVKGINHLGIAPKDPAKFRWFLNDVLKLNFMASELVSQQRTNTHMYHPNHISVSHPALPRVEVLEHAGDAPGPISTFIEKRGGGIHHIAFEVDNIDLAIADLKSKSIQLIDESPRRGAHNTLIAFVHPAATGGVLVELVQST